MRCLLLACGQFPKEILRDLGNEAFWALAEAEAGDPALTDFPAYHLPMDPLKPARVQTISFDYWQGFDCILDYFTDLIRDGDEVHAFCLPRDPAQRETLSLLDGICALAGARLRLHLF